MIKLKRNQQIVEEVSSPTNAFSEDVYVKMSVDMIRKSEVIDELKKKICVLEDKLDSGENSRRNSRSSEIILRSHEESWKNLYDLHVDIKD